MSRKERDRLKVMAAGLWRPRRPRRAVHLWRPRRAAFGELVQMDTSKHAWLEGRVERSFQTDQDRLAKEPRLRGITTIEAANAYLEAEYVPMLNRRFTHRAASSVDAHRPIRGYDLKAVLSVQTVRTVANDYTVRHGGRRYQIARRSIAGGLRGGKVVVEERLDGTHKIRFRGRHLRVHEIASPTPPANAAAQPTRPGATGSRRTRRRRGAGPASVPLASASPRRPGQDHPWRQPFQTNRTFLLCEKEDISTLR